MGCCAVVLCLSLVILVLVAGWVAGRFVVGSSVCGFWRAWFVGGVLGFGWL